MEYIKEEKKSSNKIGLCHLDDFDDHRVDHFKFTSTWGPTKALISKVGSRPFFRSTDIDPHGLIKSLHS